ncbi:MAG: hypothetical protein J6O23_04140 [Prevotella sp.]|nr:hypothetical protein [Prevotella sp.]
MVKKIVLFAMGLVATATALAQDRVETTIKGDFVNEYIWRGLKLGDVAVQPTLGVGYKGLSLTAWGSYGLSNKDDTKEMDLTLAYSTGGLNIGVTDYWFSAGLDPDNRYFRYNAHSTNHVFEAFASYDFGVASVGWYTNFAGNDGTNKDGKRAYSSYVEAVVPFSLAGVDWTATAGAVPYASTYYGTTGFAVTNVTLRATKDIRVSDSFSIPVFGQLTGNPCAQKAYLVFGFTLQP